MGQGLTIPEKRRLLTYLIERDGYKCYLCKIDFKTPKEPIIEHLNNDRTDNRWDNLALAHQSCNIKKIHDNDFTNIAEYKLEKNENQIFVGESFFEKDKENNQTSNEIEINGKCYDITEDYLTDRISKDGWVLYKGLIHNIVYLSRQKIHHGSEQSIRSHLKTLTAENAPFEITRDGEGNKIVRRRATT